MAVVLQVDVWKCVVCGFVMLVEVDRIPATSTHGANNSIDHLFDKVGTAKLMT